jgi:hypothetical protein
VTVSIRPAIQFKPVERDAPTSYGDLRQVGANGAVEEVLVHAEIDRSQFQADEAGRVLRQGAFSYGLARSPDGERSVEEDE